MIIIMIFRSAAGILGPFQEAPSLTVIMLLLCFGFLASMCNANTETAAYTAGQLLRRYTWDYLTQDIQNIIRPTNGHSFFNKAIISSLKLSMVTIWNTIAPDSIRFTGFSVLRSVSSHDDQWNIFLPPPTDWSSMKKDLRFNCSIQWFLTYI